MRRKPLGCRFGVSLTSHPKKMSHGNPLSRRPHVSSVWLAYHIVGVTILAVSFVIVGTGIRLGGFG